MRTRQRNYGGIFDETTTQIIQPVFAEYRTDDYAASES
jgi:hypothetical protein